MNNCERHLAKLELLAPAGDWEALQAALAAGADAVYLGGKVFSARQSAINFELEQIQEAARWLHLHGKKIYVTVNTLINDGEMQQAVEYLGELYNMGVDAVIIQDVGLIKLARKWIPGLKLHASTQMTVHNSDGALLLKEMGIHRVVLAREMTASEVKSIAERSGMEVEVFIHGALCVCYSGQCLMSSMIGGRSGNRGRCAQPCRLEYQLVQGDRLVRADGAYLLSPKDLSLLSVIPDLSNAGVSSLKIEGRMKGPEYVYTVTKIYRQAIDRFYQHPEDYKVDPLWAKSLEQTFNRDFSVGYFGNVRNKPLMSFTRPNNRGTYIGRVKNINDRQISIRLEANLEIGDEIEIWVSKGGRTTAAIDQLCRDGKSVRYAVSGDIVTFTVSGKVYPGDRVFKVYSARVARETEQAIANSNLALKIPCRMIVTGRLNEPMQLVCRDEEGNEVTVFSEIPLQPAKNRPLTREVLKEQLGRLGNTAFYLNELTLELEPCLMLPLSSLNQIRRKAIEKLTEVRLQPFYRDPVSPKSIGVNINHELPRPSKERTPSAWLSVWASDLSSVYEAALAGADIIYAGGDELTGFHWDQASFNRAVAMAHEAGAKLILGTPRINREKHRPVWEKYPEYAVKSGADGVIVSDLGSYKLMKEKTGLPLFLNYPLNFFNSYAQRFFDEQRVRQITVSPELTLTQIGELRKKGSAHLECLVHGPLELMVSEYCPIHSVISASEHCSRPCRKESYFLRDRLELNFPVATDQFCRMHLLNSKDLCLYSDLNRIIKINPVVLRLELKICSPEATAIITNAYRYALNKLLRGDALPPEPEKTIEHFKQLSGRGITKGHFFRGVD